MTVIPQGRLVACGLTTAGVTAYQIKDQNPSTACIYLPAIGNQITIAGTTLDFGPTPLVYNPAVHLAGTVHDIVAIDNGGTVAVGTGAAWSNLTTRAEAIALQNAGHYLNTTTLAHCFNATTDYGAIAPTNATVIGSVYFTANGVSRFDILPAPVGGGSNNILGLFNFHNRQSVTTIERDSNPGWPVNGGNWQTLGSNVGNRITVLDGLGEMQIYARINMTYSGISSGNEAITTGIFLDSVVPGGIYNAISPQGASTVPATGGTIIAEGTFVPGQGLHYMQFMQNGIGPIWLYANTYSGGLATVSI